MKALLCLSFAYNNALVPSLFLRLRPLLLGGGNMRRHRDIRGVQILGLALAVDILGLDPLLKLLLVEPGVRVQVEAPDGADEQLLGSGDGSLIEEALEVFGVDVAVVGVVDLGVQAGWVEVVAGLQLLLELLGLLGQLELPSEEPGERLFDLKRQQLVLGHLVSLPLGHRRPQKLVVARQEDLQEAAFKPNLLRVVQSVFVARVEEAAHVLALDFLYSFVAVVSAG